MRKSQNNRQSIKSYFAKAGVKFDISEDAWHRQLERLLGADRFDEWQNIRMQRQIDGFDMTHEYQMVESAAEANMLFSMQANVMLAIATWIDTHVSQHTDEPVRIYDLGCGGGALTSWLAAEYPNACVTGIDAIERFVDFASESVSLPNLGFRNWDYREAKPDELPKGDILVSGFGIDFSACTERFSLESDDARELAFYAEKKEEAISYFRRWREICRDDGLLFAVLRTPIYEHFLAVIDAAHETGWSFVEDQSTKLSVDDETFPAMTFQASNSTLINEEQAKAFWIAGIVSERFDRPFLDTMAVAMFNVLNGKQVTQTESKVFDDGHTMVTSIGTCGPFAFTYSRATTGFARLALVPLSKLHTLSIRFQFFDDPPIEPLEPVRRRSGKTPKKRKKRRK